MKLRLPDWLFYFLIVILIYMNAVRGHPDLESSIPPPDLGPLLPGEAPNDGVIRVDVDTPMSGAGTAFVIDANGTWLTARHVIDSCDEIALNIGAGRFIRAQGTVSKNTDIGVLTTSWRRDPLATDLYSRRRIGEHGYFFGFPQGRPGEAAGQLLARNRMRIRGRYRSEEPILVWSELGRTRGLTGSLGGLSGGPVMDADGEVIGIVVAESPRRGRVYTAAPRSLQTFLPQDTKGTQDAIKDATYGLYADKLRRQRRIAQVTCIVKET